MALPLRIPFHRQAISGVLKRIAPYGVATFLLLGIQRSGISEALDLLFYDLVTSLRPAPPGNARPVTIIAISESDIARYGWPIDDRLLCRAIDTLTQNGAIAIGLDIYRDKGVGPDQQCLRERFRSDPRLVSIFNVADDIGPVPGTPVNRQGFNDLVVDPDGVVRRDLVHVSGQDAATVALPLRLVEVGLGSQWLRHQLEAGTAAGPWLESASGGYTNLDAAGYQQMLSFRQPGSFPLWSLQALIDRHLVPRNEIQGRIVLIGSTAPSLRDLFPVPHTRFRSGEKQLLMPGVEIHAQRVAALLDRKDGDDSLRIRTLPPWGERLFELTIVITGVLLGEAFLGLGRSVLDVALFGAMLTLLVGALLLSNLWIGLSVPLSGLLLMAAAAWVRRGAVGLQQRQQFARLLGQTTSPAVARQLWERREELLSDGRFEGRQLPVTILMADICDFTTVSERLEPADLLAWLNRAMAECVPAITRRGGMVNKFTGDGFLAVFGAPVSRSAQEDARSAIETVLEIQAEIDRLNGVLEQEGAPRMRMRMGMHSGTVLAGSMGSTERLEYAVIGDTVNCAARLESLEKQRQSNICRVLVSSATRDLLDPDPTLRWELWGPMQVKGRDEAIEVWELRGAERESEPLRDSERESVPASPL